MKTRLIKICLSVMTVAVLAFFATSVFAGATAKVEASSITLNDITIEDSDFLVSAKVRVKDDSYGNGVRFTISLRKNKFAALLDTETTELKDGVETGVLITSKKIADALEGGLTLSAIGTAGVHNYVLDDKWHSAVYTINEESVECYSACVTIYNVPDNSLSVQFKVVPYVTYTHDAVTESVVRTNTTAKSMREVVYAIRNDESQKAVYDDIKDDYLNCAVNYFDTDGTSLGSETVFYMEEAAETPTETGKGYSTTGTRAGYTFDWYKNNSEAYDLGVVTSNLNLYAHYTMNAVTDKTADVFVDLDKYLYTNTPASVPIAQSIATANSFGTVSEVCDADDVGENVLDENGRIDISSYNWNNGASTLGEKEFIITNTSGDNYKISAVVATKVINSVSDWNSLDSIASTTDSRDNYWGGYYVLGSDIEANGSSLTRIAQHDSGDSGKGFVGVIDGRGHVINNFTIAYSGWGMIGGIGSGSVIKNLSLTNVAHPGYTALLGIRGATVNISNIYVHYKSVTYPGTGDCTGLFLGSIWDGSVDNVVIDVTNTNNNFNGSANADAFVFNSKLSYFHNCYVIGSDYIKLSYADGTTATGRYGMFYDMKVANNNLSSFNNDFWVKLSNIPYAKNAISKIGKPLFSDLGKGAQFYEGNGGKGLLKGAETKVHRMNAGSSAVKYNSSAFILSKADLNTLKALGKTTVKVAVALDNTQAADLVVTANFGTHANVTVPGANAWNYKSYVIAIPLQEVIDNYDTITASGYSFFTVTGATSMFSLSDMMVA